MVRTRRDGKTVTDITEDKETFDELVIAQESQVLPFAIVEFDKTKLEPLLKQYARDINALDDETKFAAKEKPVLDAAEEAQIERVLKSDMILRNPRDARRGSVVGNTLPERATIVAPDPPSSSSSSSFASDESQLDALLVEPRAVAVEPPERKEQSESSADNISISV